MTLPTYFCGWKGEKWLLEMIKIHCVARHITSAFKWKERSANLGTGLAFRLKTGFNSVVTTSLQKKIWSGAK